jgi:hypothetical protein
VRSGDASGLDGLSGLSLSFISSVFVSTLATWGGFDVGGHVSSPTAATPGGQFSADIDLARERIGYSSTTVTDDVPKGMRNKTITSLDLQACPDPNGRLTLKFSSDSQLTLLGDDRTGVNTLVDVTLTRQLDDNAHLLNDFDVEVRVQQASFNSAKGVFLDATYKLQKNIDTSSVNRASGAVTAAHAESASAVATAATGYAMILSLNMERAAQSGRCVNLTTETTPAARTDLAPSTPVKIIASPRSAVDGSFTAATVTARLTGGSSISPPQAPADATFDFVAPAAPRQAASVALESRSRRGVGKATLGFSTGQIVTRYEGSMTGQSGIPGAVLTQTQIDQIVWTLKEGTLQDSLVYTPAGTARVTLTMAGCSVTRTLAIDPDTSLLLVYGPDERADGRHKGYFAQVNTVKVQATLSCAALPQPLQVELMGVFRNGCDSTLTPDPGMPRYSDIQALAGSRAVGAPCNLVSADPHSWSLQAVSP